MYSIFSMHLTPHLHRFHLICPSLFVFQFSFLLEIRLYVLGKRSVIVGFDLLPVLITPPESEHKEK